MKKQGDLFGKTFDQQLEVLGDIGPDADISPNRRFLAEVVLEPLGPRIRVTARDQCHKMLWGFVACKGMLDQHPCPVTIYDTLRDLVGEELETWTTGPRTRGSSRGGESSHPQLEDTVKWLKKSLDVVKITDATKERAATIAQIAADADRQITLTRQA